MTIPAKFMAATENGTIFCGNRKMSPNQIEKSFKAHYGTIVALRRNPLIPKKFLSVGDWSAKVNNFGKRHCHFVVNFFQTQKLEYTG